MIPATGPGSAALLTRAADDRLAHVSSPLPALHEHCGYISTAQFLSHVAALAAQLPEAPYAINLCENRYLFLVSFCACLAKHQTNLLPANKTSGALAAVREQFAHSYILHDGRTQNEGILADQHAVNINQLALGTGEAVDVPLIALEHIAAIVFTSGSTGQPQPIAKPWHTFVRSTQINAGHMLAGDEQLYYGVATVPGQHMWGLETSILMPLMHRLCISDTQPFYPLDLCRALARFDTPRLLVTTPFHLRALLMSTLELPRIARMLCATAPLSAALAEQAEAACQATLREIYGCSEAGSLAVRRTATTRYWQLFDGFELQPAGTASTAATHWQLTAAHLPHVVRLQDNIDIHTAADAAPHPVYFSLHGRSQDLVKVAGKRASLMELNSVLERCTEVQDGIIFVPTTDTGGQAERVAAIVVLQPGARKEAVLQFFKTQVDPVFAPRPLYVTDALPRQDNGKISQHSLQQLYQQLQRPARSRAARQDSRD